jgi:hypothetical protein
MHDAMENGAAMALAEKAQALRDSVALPFAGDWSLLDGLKIH